MRHLAPWLGVAAALLLGIEARGANPPGALDLPPSNVMPAPVDMSPGAAPRVERSDPSGNPLWAIPLSALTATRERPLFLPSRRAPAPAVANTPVAAAPSPPSTPAPVDEQPPLTLVGAIASETEGFAVFLDQATNSVIRLKTGQDHAGWVLQSVKGREATLQKDRRTTTLVLPVPGAMPSTPAPAGMSTPHGAPINPRTKEPEL
jgi:general secretion pathway protein N